jgi:hypothetical protein
MAYNPTRDHAAAHAAFNAAYAAASGTALDRAVQGMEALGAAQAVILRKQALQIQKRDARRLVAKILAGEIGVEEWLSMAGYSRRNRRTMEIAERYLRRRVARAVAAVAVAIGEAA